MTSGLLLVDKPSGPTSFSLVAAARRRFHQRRVGHLGTLDPLASGLLPILLGEATKLEPFLHDLDKVYRATVRLGLATTTFDAEGEVVATAPPDALQRLDEAAVRGALATFVGEIQQKPPIYSAVKIDGKRLYALARRGEVDAAAVAPRLVVVHEAVVERLEPPELVFRLRCGKGTYVRSIAHELGERLGVHGHLTALRRLRIGPFEVGAAGDLLGSGELPPPLGLAAATDHLPSLAIDPETEERLRRGQQGGLGELGLPAVGSCARLLDRAGRLVAIVARGAEGWALARVFHVDG